LHAVGLVEVVKTRASAGLVDDQLLARFNQRVAAELEREPLDLEVAEHRQRLAELLVDLGELDHYQLLGVSIAATTDDVYDAYRRLARMVHPSHAGRLGLTGLEEAVSLLFERATEAYLVLSDPERRSRYNREMGLVQQAVAVDPAKDREQLALMARQHFLQAQHLVQDEEYHYAVELLRQAIRSDPRPEYYALLGEVQSKNPNWLRQAADSFRHAVRLAPGDMSLRLSLGQTFEELGDLQRALAVYRGIVVRKADHQEAQAAIERLGGHRTSRRGGLLGQIFGRS
jgi:curved DNA-binding protein CbpA